MSAAVVLLRSCAVGALAICYVILSHYTLITPGHETLGTIVALTPIVLAIASFSWNTGYRFVVLLLIASIVWILIEWQHTAGLHYRHLYWIEHAGTQLLLCAMFGRTLFSGREPLCTHFARVVHGSVTPALERYTRQVTVAWTIFFALMASMSTLLFFATTIRVWSIFANFFTALLTCSMFIAEYAVRRTRDLGTEHVPIMAAVKVFWNTPENR